MPGRGKRLFEDFDPNKSDSADSDYDASTSRPARSKPTRSQRSKPPRKKQKTGGYDGSEDISDESDATQESYQEHVSQDELEPEIDENTGRPVRQAKKNRIQYKESDEEDDAFGEAESASEVVQPKNKKKKAEKSKMITLKMPPKAPSVQPRRSTRARSGSLSTKRPPTADPHSGGTRRSSRIAHDDSVPIVALTDSGHHADIIRPATRSPEAVTQRPTRGSKGVKQPPQSSTIHEEEEEDSARTKDEPDVESHHPSTTSINQEIAASREDLNDEVEESDAQDKTETQDVADEQQIQYADDDGEEPIAVAESGGEDEDEDEDEDLVKKPRRLTRRGLAKDTSHTPPNRQEDRQSRRDLRSAAQKGPTQSSQGGRKRGFEESSDFEPMPEEVADDNVSDSADSGGSPRKASQRRDDSSSSNARKSARLGKQRATNRREQASDEQDSEVAEELAEELEDLRTSRPRRTQRKEDGILFETRRPTRNQPRRNYEQKALTKLGLQLEDDEPTVATPSKKRAGANTWQRGLFSVEGPFGGAGGPPPVFGGPGGIGAAGGVDSDSSDDDMHRPPRVQGVGGMAGKTPTTAAPTGFGLFPPALTHGSDPAQGSAGTPANLGRIKDKTALADADPLGVDQNVNFDSVGGLQDHIDKLKEMVALPLLYPEVFQRFHVTPPRGVLFHGPPGTGKTLLARALASSVSSQGKKVTFYMRKGADALSKWVGEAERQLRLLFEEARKTQPSIIFFDEIDGLAPVRSSKQEQIHASIVSTLLALMDGMDGRGQVIVIGATNRPDSVDPALRRPGRFDREFYFPLPNTEGRRAILNIHTKGWEPPLSEKLKDELAELTKGYGGADLRALCTEAALNAVQRTYPQIYKSDEKLQIKPETINITAKDFMISVKKTVPSSERTASSGAAPLPKSIEPLLRIPLMKIQNAVAHILPQKKNLTALEEAEFEDAEGDRGMRTERMQQEFERSRIFRPRLLIRGKPGLGQQYLAAALLNHFEGLHVGSFDLPTLMSDSTKSAEATVIQLFTEVKRHRPSVVYIPNVDIWWSTLSETSKATFLGLLRSITPSDPILILGVLENDETVVDQHMIKDLFGFSKQNQFELTKPQRTWRREFFEPIIDYLNTSPEDFPEPSNRKKRIFDKLLPVPPEPQKEPEPPTKEEMKAQRRKDRLTLNMLKLRIQPIMNEIRKYKKFRVGVVEENQIQYLLEEQDPNIVTTDLPLERRQEEAARFRPYELGKDHNGEPGLVEQVSKKFVYNMDIVTIEKRLSNGYYKRPKDFVSDIRKLTRDAKVVEDQDRIMKANELQANVEVDVSSLIEIPDPAFTAECEALWQRETRREREKVNKAKQLATAEGRELQPIQSNVPPADITSSIDNESGPITLGQPLLTNGVRKHPITPQSNSDPSNLTNGYANDISDLSNLDGRPSNGTSDPSNQSKVEDPRTSSSQDRPSTGRTHSSWGPSAQTRPAYSHTGGPSTLHQRQSQLQSLSQKSAMTPLAQDSNPAMYTNEASTTSSSKPHTLSSNAINTQSTHSQPNGPDVSALGDPTCPNSQLPETQISPPSSQGRRGTQEEFSGLDYLPSQAANHIDSGPQSRHSQSQPHTQTPAVPPFPRSSSVNIHSLLNNPPPPPQTSTAVATLPSHPQIITDLVITQDFHAFVVEQTSSCSVEQLEQIYSALMGEIWETRGMWDRVAVTNGVRRVLTECLSDMKTCQSFMEASLASLEGVTQFG